MSKDLPDPGDAVSKTVFPKAGKFFFRSTALRRTAVFASQAAFLI
jgi:hypothetical protein